MKSNRLILATVVALSLVACDDKPANTDSATPEKGATSSKAADSKAAKKGPTDLAPLPLTIVVPPGGRGTMDKSRGDHKSVMVDAGGGKSINVSLLKGGIAGLKTKIEKDVVYPFKSWSVDKPDTLVVEFESDGKSGFHGFKVVKIGGAEYQCRTTGMDGLPSADAASKMLKTCDSLKAK